MPIKPCAPHTGRRGPIVAARGGNDPDVGVPATTGAALEHELARCEQRLPSPTIGAVSHAGSSAQLLSRQPADDAALVGDRRQRGEHQPSRSRCAAVPQHRLHELGVDLRVPPRPRRGEHEPHGARPPTAGRALIDSDQPSAHELLASLLVAATLPPRTSRSPPDRSSRASTAAIAFRLIADPRTDCTRHGVRARAGLSEAAVIFAPVHARTQSFRCCLDPPQLLAQLARGSKRLRGPVAVTVTRRSACPAVALSTLQAHLPGAIRLRGEGRDRTGHVVAAPRSPQRGRQHRQSPANQDTTSGPGRGREPRNCQQISRF